MEGRNGQPGMGRDKHGRNAETHIMKVPLGTVVIDQAKADHKFSSTSKSLYY